MVANFLTLVDEFDFEERKDHFVSSLLEREMVAKMSALFVVNEV